VILAGDIGGTKTALAWVDNHAVVDSRSYPSANYRSLTDIVQEFVAVSAPGQAHAACFGVAGPIVNGVVRTTNLPWVIDAKDFHALIGTSSMRLINDLEAIAYGVGAVGDDAFVTLNAGRSDGTGNAAVIAAGTGLGEAGLYWDGRVHRPFASEGGHASFAPRDDIEIALLQFLLADHGHVSWERVLSGPGLYNIYRFLLDEGLHDEPAWLAERLSAEDPAAMIAECALGHTSPLCDQALQVFVSLYGAEAGNLALKTFATGGVFVAEGIAPKILPALTDGAFMRAFLGKGRLRSVLEAIPVRVVVSGTVALLGAARAAVSRE
jgi:glucokinase